MRTDTQVWNPVARQSEVIDVCADRRQASLRSDGVIIRRPRTGDLRYVGVVGRVRFMCEFLDWAAAVGRWSPI